MQHCTIILALIYLLVAQASPAYAWQGNREQVDETHPDFAVPVNAERRAMLQRDLENWYRENYLDVYAKHPHADAARDKLLREAYEAYIAYSLRNVNLLPNVRATTLKTMTKAGVSNPVDPVLYWLISRLMFRDGSAGTPTRWNPQATKILSETLTYIEKRNVPAIVRAKVCADIVVGCAMDVMLTKIAPTSAKQDDAQTYFKKFVEQVAASLKGGHRINQLDALLSWEMILENAKYLQQDTGDWMKQIDTALEPVENSAALRGAMAGIYHIKAGWAIRGGGTAGTVGEQAWKGFSEHLNKAVERLEAGWADADRDKNYHLASRMASYMVTAGMGLQFERSKIATWFRRGMEADGGTAGLFTHYLLYLDPKWHGSPQEMIALGRAALATKDWKSDIPRMVVVVHNKVSAMTPNKEKYLAMPEVWDDIETYFTHALKAYPQNPRLRTEYLVFAIQSGKADLAKAQFDELQGELDPSVVKPWEEQNLLKRVGLEPKKRTNEPPLKK